MGIACVWLVVGVGGDDDEDLLFAVVAVVVSSNLLDRDTEGTSLRVFAKMFAMLRYSELLVVAWSYGLFEIV